MENNNNTFSNLLSLIKAPSLTEKAINLYNNRQYTFIIDNSLKKSQIKFLLEQIFNITIINIQTLRMPIKMKRVGKFKGKCSQYKKAIIKLKEGEKITELFN
jgi:large subunit ribosomal protein L23